MPRNARRRWLLSVSSASAAADGGGAIAGAMLLIIEVPQLTVRKRGECRKEIPGEGGKLGLFPSTPAVGAYRRGHLLLAAILPEPQGHHRSRIQRGRYRCAVQGRVSGRNSPRILRQFNYRERAVEPQALRVIHDSVVLDRSVWSGVVLRTVQY